MNLSPRAEEWRLMAFLNLALKALQEESYTEEEHQLISEICEHYLMTQPLSHAQTEILIDIQVQLFLTGCFTEN